MLPEIDVEFLREKGFVFETIREGGFVNLVIRDCPLPPVYKPSVVDLLIRLPAGYPNVNPDMFWTRPTVSLVNGGAPPLAANVQETYNGVPWQRWSRHINGWRLGIDGLRSFWASTRRELDKGL